MSLVANVVRSAIAEAASLTMSQPQKDDSLIEIWLVCASAVIVQFRHAYGLLERAIAADPLTQPVSFAEMLTMVALYDAATAAYHMIASTRPLPGLEVPLLPAPQNGNGRAQANSPQLPIATNAVHDTVPLKQRQAPSQAQPSAIMPSIPTQSTPAPQQQRQQPPPSPQIPDAGHQLPSRFSALSSSTKLAAGHKRRNSASTGDSTIPGCSSDESSKKTRLSAQPDLPVDAGHGSCVVNIEVGQRGPLSTFATSSSKASNTSGPVDQRRPCPAQNAVLSHDLLRQSQVKRPEYKSLAETVAALRGKDPRRRETTRTRRK